MKQIDEKTIALQTFLSIDLLGSLTNSIRTNPDKTLSDFFNDWQKSHRWDSTESYSIVNQGVILTHLYGLIAYPKEVFNNQIPIIKLDQIDKKEWGRFEFISFPSPSLLSKKDKGVFGVETVTSEREMTLEFLVRKIRNSISHAHITIYKNMDFDFEDKDGTKIHFDISGLHQFTRKFKSCYVSNKWE